MVSPNEAQRKLLIQHASTYTNLAARPLPWTEQDYADWRSFLRQLLEQFGPILIELLLGLIIAQQEATAQQGP